MEFKAYFKDLKISPRKLRFIMPEIKKLKPVEAMEKLFYSPKRGAKVFYKAIKSAVDNAKQSLKTDDNLLKFKVLTVEEGHKLKRFRPGGRGGVKPYVHRFSHLKIILETVEKSLPLKVKTKTEETKTQKHGSKS